MILRIGAGIVILLIAAACAILEVFYLPLRAGLIPIPLSVVSAGVLNVIFTRAIYSFTGSVLAALLPGAVWLGIIARAASARPEGDLLITDGASSTGLAVVNLGFLIVGALSLVFAVATLRRRLSPDRARPRLAATARHSPRRWPLRQPRAAPEGGHSAARHRPRPHGLRREPEVTQPPETAGIT